MKLPTWRPRFSVRTLVTLVTLVCCYVACWGPTKHRGVVDVEERCGPIEVKRSTEAIAPFLVRVADETIISLAFDSGPEYHYYFWFFGFVAKLSIETKPDSGGTSDEWDTPADVHHDSATPRDQG